MSENAFVVVTFASLVIGSMFVGIAFGPAAGLGAFFCLFAIGAEIQRSGQ